MSEIKTIEEFTLEECEMFLKRSDLIIEDRIRAEHRKDYLHLYMAQQPQKSILEMFPEYGFVPTSIMSRTTTKKKSYGWVPISIGCLLLLGGAVLFVLWLILYGYLGDVSGNFPFITGVSLFGCGLLILLLGCAYRKKFNPIRTIADYIPKKRQRRTPKKMRIFVKNRKFGVLKKGFNKIVIPAEYDKLSWFDKNILKAERDGRHFLIDLYGNELV